MNSGVCMRKDCRFSAVRNVAYWPKADILIAPRDVRLRGNSGHRNSTMSCPVVTQLRHGALFCRHAQSTLNLSYCAKLPTIGFLGPNTASIDRERVGVFVQRLRELGWIEGRTVAIEYRWAEGRNERAWLDHSGDAARYRRPSDRMRAG
jgi:hypothetical protein